jgi:plastocyanin
MSGRAVTYAGLAIALTALCACSSDKSSGLPAPGPSTSAAPGGGQTRVVSVDGQTTAFHAAFLSYFPKSVMVHPGDTVVFRDVDNGDPHSITMGGLVEKGLTAVATASPDGPPPPDFAALPVMLPEGPGDAVQAAAAPCYLASGTPPTDPAKACPAVAQPDFDGTQSYYSSGAIRPNETWSAHLAPTIRPGTYHYYCDLHGPDMGGEIVVVPASQSIPSQADVDATGRRQLEAMADKVSAGYEAADSGHGDMPGYLAGLLSQDEQHVAINEFIPRVIQAKVGQVVTWTVMGPHTLTVGGPDPAPPVLVFAPDGGVHLQGAVLAPQGGPGQPAGPPPSGPPATGRPDPVAITSGPYDGTGERSSGVVVSFPPQLFTYSMSFSKPGKYTVDCLLHPHMEATILVTE